MTTSAKREPEKAVAKCKFPGCKWTRIYFRRGGAFYEAEETWTPAVRAAAALRSHQRTHKQKVKINGR